MRLGWDASRTRTLVKAALTMNVAITDVQGRFAAVGHLTERQRDQIRAHPQEAVQALRAGGVEDEVWLRAVEQHHERAGGSGYPMGLQEVDETAMALRMADVFMAKISPRVERAALSVQDAARQMYAEAQGHPSAAAIIKEYGIYPPGNVVKLASGELADRDPARRHCAGCVGCCSDRQGRHAGGPHRPARYLAASLRDSVIGP
jgi:HD-GYP domain-containing protein (c-di-GMP phosphodiesterase class II)